MPEHGRYLISVKDAQAGDPGKVVIHDSTNFNEQCNTDQIRQKSYFNNLEWAIEKGYRLCQHCMTKKDE